MMFLPKMSIRRIIFLSLIPLLTSTLLAQTGKRPEKKYPSLLWEITGKGVKTPSYLFGTMHVSNKMVFNLGDSFYHAIEHTDYVGLELDPGYWQEYFSQKDRANMGDANPFESLERRFRQNTGPTSLTKSMFAIKSYEEKIEEALTLEPTIINSLLYRKSQGGQEYEEDTYLDMYLYQICKKLNKKIAGLEVMETSEKMSKQAMLALQEGRNRNFNYNNEDDPNTISVEDAYKTGDLDMLDSIERREMPVPKFRSIFIDQRNEIQAASIDSIIRTGHSIFAGVGAAHLPGPNGVIEELRKKGYRLRPVKLSNHNSLEKDRIDKIHYPVQFATRYTTDSVIKADIPGNWYRFHTSGNLVQYSDLANGSYYILTRVPVDALFWGHTGAGVLRKIDSMLYENIPGKILSKTVITNSGYRGIDITNRTRRGDRQRYQIFVTPFEVIIAKMSGIGDYVATGTEGASFFNSIRIRSLEKTAPILFTPAWGAFSVALPHQPYVVNRISGNTLQPYRYVATDVHKGISYTIIKATRQRSAVLEEDTFELNLLSESYRSSKMVVKETGKKYLTVNGYPALETTYQLKNSMYSTARYIIQGPHYYAIIAQQAGKPFTTTPPTLASFRIQPFQYSTATLQTDSILGFTLQSPVSLGTDGNDAEDLAMITAALPQQMSTLGVLFRSFYSRALLHDSTGESIKISGIRFPPYTYLQDTTRLQNLFGINEDADFVVKQKKATVQNGWQVAEHWYTDTGSSRTIHSKTFYRNGVMAALQYYSDTLTGDSPFAGEVFRSFMPADTIRGANPFEPKGPLFFKEYASNDSVTHARAVSHLSAIRFRKEDLPQLKQTLTALRWDNPGYLGLKKRLIAALGSIGDASATDYLKELYAQANDTALYQQQVLYSLLNQRTQASFKAFEELITTNPPVEVSSNNSLDAVEDDGNKMAQMLWRLSGISLNNGESNTDLDWDQLSDTMQLTQSILPGLLNLMNLDDYRDKMEDLVNAMADSGFVKPEVLQPFYTKFLLEARQEYKKAVAAESENRMKKKTESLKKNDDDADDGSQGNYRGYSFRYGSNRNNSGHEELYEKLVMLTPFYDKQPAVKELFRQSFALKDDAHLYKLLKLTIRKNMAAYPDTLLQHFAADAEYRYRLYDFLYRQDKLRLFPQAYSSPLELAKSRFQADNLSENDTMVYVAKRPFTLWRKSGEVYFFKYKPKKGDNWKWGMVEMVPSEKKPGYWDMYYDHLDEATSKKWEDDKTPDEQIDTLLKEKLTSKRPSARQFYTTPTNNRGYYSYYQNNEGEEE